MKKYFWQCTSLVLAATLLFSFHNNKADTGPECSSVCIVKDQLHPFTGFDPKLAFDMVKNYKTARYGNISIKDQAAKGGIRQDSRSVWFSLKRLKQFVYELETNTCSKACTPELGIRVYFSVYPNLDSDAWKSAYGFNLGGKYGNLPSEYTNMQTVLLVPTIMQNGFNTDFDFHFYDKATCTAKTMEEAMKATVSAEVGDSIYKITLGKATIFGASEDNVPDLNHGNLKPPPYDDPGKFAVIKRNCTGTGLMNMVDNMSCGPTKYEPKLQNEVKLFKEF